MNVEVKMYTIQKNFPIPQSKYPFDKMEVGDSFVTPIKERSSVYGNFRKHAPKLTPGFKIKGKMDEGRALYRVWRIA